MKKIMFVFCALSLGIVASTLLLVLCISLPCFAQSEIAERRASEAWNNINNHTDADKLDMFIRDYPNTDMAILAFLTRYSLLTQNPTIEDYHAFLAKYPQKFQSQMVLQEVFNLYKEQNRAVAWFDFLKRYSHTHQGLVAKLHLQTLLAQFAILCDTEEAYDDFIEMFPDAPQIPAIMELAEKKAVEEERVKFREIATDALKEQRANTIVYDWEQLHSELSEVFPDPKTAIIENGRAFLIATRIRRGVKVISLYSAYPPAGRVRTEHRHQELLKKLDSIQQTLIDNHKELVKTIREEAALTRETIRTEFEKLGLRMDAGFKMLGDKMDILHKDLVLVYQELQKVNLNLENIRTAILDSNKQLERLDAALEETRKALENGFTDTVGAIARVGNKIDDLTNEVADFKLQTVDRLDRVIERQDRSYDLQIKSFETQLQQLVIAEDTRDLTRDIRGNQEVMIVQNDKIIDLSNEQLGALNNIQRTQVEQLNTLNGLRGDVQGMHRDVQGLRGDVQVLRNDVRQGFNRMDKTMRAGFTNVQKSIYKASDRVIQSNQQTILRIQQQQQREQQAASSSGGSGGGIKSFFGKVLKVGVTAVGTYFGGPVGGAIGASLGSALDKAIQGGNRREVVSSAVNTGISAGIGSIGNSGTSNYYPNSKIETPPAQQLFENIVAEGKNVLKPEVEKTIRERFPKDKEAVSLINSMLKGNFEQRKRMAIKAVASVIPNKTNVESATVQRILDAQNEQDLRNILIQIANQEKLNPSVILYAMDYIL